MAQSVVGHTAQLVGGRFPDISTTIPGSVQKVVQPTFGEAKCSVGRAVAAHIHEAFNKGAVLFTEHDSSSESERGALLAGHPSSRRVGSLSALIS